MDPATGRNIVSQTVSRRRIPDAYKGSGGGEELKTYHNYGTPHVEPPKLPESQAGYGLSTKRAVTFFVQNNLAFSIFVFLFIPIFIYIFLAFFAFFSGGLNIFLFGIFKRPLPDNAALYYDVNCIDRMNRADFENTNQVQRCREMNNIDRPGPPRRF